ncbi:hypothetical protein EIP91_009923 [Steccherinum ochraceum]|uniref:Nephrocystin 3-like N-terminal domain-containing protein n=1 Tax=Steccherinum ochraceum TaxID=92696 RepID=A0A4V2MV01_9APHY|nr:hypothetical protein EIP91_009923 [Steccherinum ochraceum]
MGPRQLEGGMRVRCVQLQQRGGLLAKLRKLPAHKSLWHPHSQAHTDHSSSFLTSFHATIYLMREHAKKFLGLLKPTDSRLAISSFAHGSAYSFSSPHPSSNPSRSSTPVPPSIVLSDESVGIAPVSPLPPQTTGGLQVPSGSGVPDLRAASTLTPASPSTSQLNVAASSLESQAWTKAWAGFKDFALLAGQTLETSLPLIAAAVDTVPIAKGVVAGLVAVLEIAKTTKDNKEKIGSTISRLERLEEMVRRGSQQVQYTWNNHGFRLADVLRTLVDMKKRNIISGFMASKHDQDQVLDCVSRIDVVLSDFDLELGIQTLDTVVQVQEGLNNLTALVSEGLASTSSRMRLNYSEDMEYHAAQKARKRTACLEGTRTQILEELNSWIAEENVPLLWLNGMAGTGKSTIADSFFASLENNNDVHVAAAFCSRDSEKTDDIFRILPSLAYQLTYSYKAYHSALEVALKNEPSLQQLDLPAQLAKLILTPLCKIPDGCVSPVLFLIDAPDECRGDQIHDTFVDTLLSWADRLCKARVKVFISSRPAPAISVKFKAGASGRPRGRMIVLSETSSEDTHHDIWAYVQKQLQNVKEKDVSFTFSSDDVDTITEASHPLFIFASTVCAHISGRDTEGFHVDHDERLKRIKLHISSAKKHASASSGGSSEGNVDQIMVSLGGLYQIVLADAFRFDSVERAEKATSVLACIILLFWPLDSAALAELLGGNYTSQKIRGLLRGLHSVINAPDDDTQPIRAIHASFHDYLISPGPKPLSIVPSFHHRELALRCIQLMTRMLVKDNMCNLRVHAWYSREEIEKRRRTFISPALEYACQHWLAHLAAAKRGSGLDCVVVPLLKFVSECLLRWIEVLVIVQGSYWSDGDKSPAQRLGTVLSVGDALLA